MFVERGIYKQKDPFLFNGMQISCRVFYNLAIIWKLYCLVESFWNLDNNDMTKNLMNVKNLQMSN